MSHSVEEGNNFNKDISDRQVASIGNKWVLLSAHADRHVGDISFTVCLFVFCLSAGLW